MLIPILALSSALADEPSATLDEDGPHYVWSIEPIKLSSLMLNTHPDWAAWGIESGVRVSEHLWIQVFLEIDKGSQLNGFYTEGRDFLLSHNYVALVNTGRWYFKPDRSSGFVDAGVALQGLRQQYLDPSRQAQQRNGFTVTPVVLAGYEAMFGPGLFFKIRGGGGWNAHRGGNIDGHLDLDEHARLARTYYNPYTHLTEVFFQPFIYVGDVAFGAKFGARKRKR
ncbi:MAG: hypothetical protein AAGA48_08740 [Myxococcota bacterium]